MFGPQRVQIQGDGYIWGGCFYAEYKISPDEALRIIEKTGAKWVVMFLPEYGIDTLSLPCSKAKQILLDYLSEINQ